ncbi:MAG: replication restart helicase PriA, partial [Oscillospiraceae bacterium]
MNLFAMTAVNDTAPSFDQLFAYRIPEELKEFCVPGARVTVPFGRSNAVRTGIIMSVSDSYSGEAKSILDVERPEQRVIDGEMIDLINFLKDRTFCTYSDAVRTVLPKNIRAVARGGALDIQSKAHLMTVLSRNPEYAGKVTKRQGEILEVLGSRSMTASLLCSASGASRETVSRMVREGILTESEETRGQDLFRGEGSGDLEEDLTEAQKKAFSEIEGYFSSGKRTVLLRGITSSGKTLIYVKLIEKAVAQGKGVIFMVPEIALSNQTIMRLRKVFGRNVAIINSSLSDTERTLEWEKIRSGECPVVIGTRSAVFSPVKNLGLIIMDEEQEQTYCSEQNPRYYAAEIAQYRARKSGAFLLLASATPLIEHYYLGKTGRIGLVELTERYNSMPLPKVGIIDMRRELTEGNQTCISAYLMDAIKDRLAKKQQTLLLLNRRGYHTISVCTNCRTVLKCPNCDTPLVWHKTEEKYICHYCGYRTGADTACPECGGALRQQGFGTEKIEETVSAMFPGARVTRLDL